jgi:hypothetical protein
MTYSITHSSEIQRINQGVEPHPPRQFSPSSLSTIFVVLLSRPRPFTDHDLSAAKHAWDQRHVGWNGELQEAKGERGCDEAGKTQADTTEGQGVDG